MVATKLMDDIHNLKQSLEGYLSECIDEIINSKKLVQAIELQNNLIKYGFSDKCQQMEQFIEATKIKKFKYNCSIHKGKITDDFLKTMPYLEIGLSAC